MLGFVKSISRRHFLGTATLATACSWPQLQLAHGAVTHPPAAMEGRIRGLLLGSALGDALGGPIEFQSRESVQGLAEPPKVWQPGEQLDSTARAAAGRRLKLRSYSDLRPGTESYGQWNPNSVPGTITDDTRHKLVLLHALHQADRANEWPITVKNLARAYLEWPATQAVIGRPGYEDLARDWLEEWQLAARWVLGDRDQAKALPPERMWQSLPTCCGQMTLLPLAAVFAGQPEQAYRAAYSLAFFDNGFGKDLNAALVASLAQALITPVTPDQPRLAFDRILAVMRETDPLRFRNIRWSERAVDRWLNLALRFARDARGEPARLFDALEKEFAHTTKWEAQVPFVVTFACLELTGYDALAALQLSMEWGHDTDSYAQLVGAFAGALHGPDIFPSPWRDALASRLQADHGLNLESECSFLSRLRGLAQHQPLVAGL